jgi:Rrf2 family protein
LTYFSNSGIVIPKYRIEVFMARAFNISEAGAMALHTMVLLAGTPDEPLTARAISERLLRSEAHLSKVLQRLARAGFVTSTRGPSGGFVLARPAAEIVMLDVYEAIEGPLGDINCTWTPPVCDGTTCVFGQLVVLVNQQVRDYLGAIRLSELELKGLGRLIRKSPPAAGRQKARGRT